MKKHERDYLIKYVRKSALELPGVDTDCWLQVFYSPWWMPLVGHWPWRSIKKITVHRGKKGPLLYRFEFT